MLGFLLWVNGFSQVWFKLRWSQSNSIWTRSEWLMSISINNKENSVLAWFLWFEIPFLKKFVTKFGPVANQIMPCAILGLTISPNLFSHPRLVLACFFDAWTCISYSILTIFLYFTVHPTTFSSKGSRLRWRMLESRPSYCLKTARIFF